MAFAGLGATSPPGGSGPHSGGPSAPDRFRRFGRYVLCSEIAHGGMAVVHLARTEAIAGFRKWVAIKTIHPHLAVERRFVEMFMNEARLAARLDHPNIGSVLDYGQQDGVSYLAMEFLRGEPLSSVAGACRDRGTNMPWSVAVRIVIDASRGLHFAHELRDAAGQLVELVHRDVSPQNIFVLYDGVTKVVDFGVARSRDNIGELTATGEIKGKLGYMAPEQLLSKPIDRRVDVFALGTVLWEMIAGRRLFRRENDGATIQAILMEPVPELPPTPGLPPAIEAVLRRALDRDPGSRFATADDFARELERVVSRSGALAGQIDVGDFMRSLFESQIAAREVRLRQLGAAPDPGPDEMPAASGSLSGVLRAPGSGPFSAPPEVSHLQRRPVATRPLFAIVAGVVVIVAAGVGAALALRVAGHSNAGASAAALPPVTVAPQAPVLAPPVAGTPPAAAPVPLVAPPAGAPRSGTGRRPGRNVGAQSAVAPAQPVAAPPVAHAPTTGAPRSRTPELM
ncbi:MAG: protein kinase, partial [Deltaproteobacteria bacterium]